jgi:hypothetical protein
VEYRVEIQETNSAQSQDPNGRHYRADRQGRYFDFKKEQKQKIKEIN